MATYVYKHHQGFDFYLSDREKTPEELYCPHCEDSDTLLGVYETEEELSAMLHELFYHLTLVPCKEYDEIL